MTETNYEMISRFKKHIRDSNENVFFIFPDDEKEGNDKCYYIETNVFSEYSDLILNGVDDEEVARIEYDHNLSDNDKYLELIINTFVNFIGLDLIEEDYNTVKYIRHNIKQLEKLRGTA